MRPVVHYMMGGVHTDINGATPLAGLYAAGRGRLRQHQRRQSARIQLAARTAGLRRARRARGRRVRVARRRSPGRRCWRQATDERRRLSSDVSATRPAAASASPRVRDEMQKTMEESAGIYRTGDALGRRRRDKLRELQERARRDQPWRTTAGRSTPSCDRGAGTVLHARRGRGHRRLGAAPRGIARRASAHRLPRARRPALPVAFAGRTATPTARRRIEYLPVTITRWPPGERVYGR